MSRPKYVPMVCVALLSVGLAACSRNDGRTMKEPRADQTETIAIATTVPIPETVSAGNDLPEMTLTTPWQPDTAIDISFTCDGTNSSPALSWTGIAPTTGSLAIVLSDDDAPEYVHWVVSNIAPTTTGFAAGQVSPESVVAKNSSGVVGYSGPCPPPGTTHTYALTLYALDQTIEATPGDDASAMRDAIEAASTDATVSTFTFRR